MSTKMNNPAPRLQESDRGKIVLDDVTKYVGFNESEKAVVQNCSLTILPGKLNVIIGPSGCGKSTLLNLIAGFDKPDGGNIRIDDVQIEGPGSDRLVVFQESALFDWMSTYENIVFGPRARHESSQSIRKKAESILERVGLRSFENKYPTQLSGGMQRRVELARAVINDPAVMLLDEPFRGLDAMTKGLMQEYFLQLYLEHPRTVVFVTSDIDEAILLADRLIILTNAPATLRKIIDIDFLKVRSAKFLYEDDRANEIKREALELLYEEALKSFPGQKRGNSDFLKAYAARKQVEHLEGR